MHPFFIIILSVLGAALFVLLLVLLLAYITYRLIFYHDPKRDKVDPYKYIKDNDEPRNLFSKSLIDNILKIPYEDIYVTSHDGLRLHARLYTVSDGAPFALQFHGYKSSPMIDFSGGGVFAMEMGFNVITVDERACGESEGKTVSFGFFEAEDALCWIDYVGERWGRDRKIMIFGMSLGAATVVLRAGLGVPESVVGAVADCPYSSTRRILMKEIGERHLSPGLLYPAVRLGAKIFGGFDPDLAEPAVHVANAKIPILLIHGEGDKFVPCDMSRSIARSSSLVSLHTFPEAGHGLSFIYDTDRYKTIVADFVDRCMNNGKITDFAN